MRNILLILIGVFICETVLAQTQSDEAAIADVLEKFQKGIMEKDSVLLNNLFFDKTTPVIGVMSVLTEKSVQQRNPAFQGLSVSNSSRFIEEICSSTNKQQEIMANIKIDISERIAAVSFIYAFSKDNTVLQWGQENWTMLFAENQWFISGITFSVKYPNVEELPKILKDKIPNR
jgi:hypothetical protein